ncbi:MAG: hypothetical protein WCA32_22315 [Chromatiaceae bacterium]
MSDLDLSLLRPLLADVPVTWVRAQRDLLEFVGFLERLAGELEE